MVVCDLIVPRPGQSTGLDCGRLIVFLLAITLSFRVLRCLLGRLLAILLALAGPGCSWEQLKSGSVGLQKGTVGLQQSTKDRAILSEKSTVGQECGIRESALREHASWDRGVSNGVASTHLALAFLPLATIVVLAFTIVFAFSILAVAY